MPSERTLKNRILAFISEQRPPVVIMGYPIALAGATLALGNLPTPLEMLQIFVAVYFIVSSMHIINGVIDFERDKKKWPMRPLATGLVERHEFVIYGILMGAIGTFLAYYWFNWQCALIVAFVVITGMLYINYLRDKIGFLPLMWILALMPIGAWVAFAPQTVFTPLPWLLYLFLAVHQIGHMVSEELHDPETKGFIIEPGLQKRPMLYVLSILLMLVVGVVIYLSTALHWIYLMALFALTAFSLISAVPMVKEPTSTENFRKANMVIVNYNIVYWLALGVIL
ncbi:MAG: UbiA family prenyltransferase [Methanocellales archaeon]|nr:UbiA family prenyltransferase [Methanocellales archaeon]